MRHVAWLSMVGALSWIGCSGDAGAGDSESAGSDAAIEAEPSPDAPVVSDDAASEAALDAGSDSATTDSADAKPSCKLADSGAIVASSDGQIIENLHIVASGTPGITVNGHKNVVIRNVWIEHTGAAGISVVSAPGTHIEGVYVDHTGAPASGANDSANRNDIDCYASSGLLVTGARLNRGSSGIYLNKCAAAELRQIEGYDFRGPFPRGQLVQFNNSDDGLLDGFSVVNGHTSWTEDNVNVYQSKGIVIRNGFIDGNNSPSGVGVIFDGTTGAGLVEDVDAIHMGNGCFSNYAGADGNTFRRVRCRDNICTGQDGRAKPLSNALMFCGGAKTSLEQAKYFASCNGNLTWPNESFTTRDLSKDDFTPRAQIHVPLCWE